MSHVQVADKRIPRNTNFIHQLISDHREDARSRKNCLSSVNRAKVVLILLPYYFCDIGILATVDAAQKIGGDVDILIAGYKLEGTVGKEAAAISGNCYNLKIYDIEYICMFLTIHIQVTALLYCITGTASYAVAVSIVVLITSINPS